MILQPIDKIMQNLGLCAIKCNGQTNPCPKITSVTENPVHLSTSLFVRDKWLLCQHGDYGK